MDEVIQYGPKMTALTPLQRNFVLAMVTHPGLPDWRYAELAGYANASGDNLTWRVRACELLQQKSINEAIHECAGMRLRSAALVATEVLIKIAGDAEASNGMRIKASEALLDRVGLSPQQNIHVEHNHTDRTGAALMDRIKELAAKHGLDPERLLGGQTKPELSPPLELKAADDV